MRVGANVPVARLAGARSGDFRIVVFRHTAPLPKTERGKAFGLEQDLDSLLNWITEHGPTEVGADRRSATRGHCTLRPAGHRLAFNPRREPAQGEMEIA
jgi:hypothetical protein